MSKSTFIDRLDNVVYSDGCNMGTTGVLTVDLTAIGENYMLLRDLGKDSQCAAVVKADAYGTGVKQVAPYLHKLGCKTFFVATLDEGIYLRSLLGEVKVYILDGLLPGCAANYQKYNLSPVLSSLEMLVEWQAYCQTIQDPPIAALHIDSGMNRLGFGPDQLASLINSPELQQVKIDLIMSHLACANEPRHLRNQHQLDIFTKALKKLPTADISLVNSAGIFLGTDYHFDLLRPGIALYGGCPVNGIANPLKSVVTLTSSITQIRNVAKGDAIGYGATYVVDRKTRLATIPVGYADGYHRSLGCSNERNGAYVYIGGQRAPLRGRVSMDLITVDITNTPPNKAFVGAQVELLGPHISIDDLADIAGTIGYEILSSLGARYKRRYTGGPDGTS